MHPARLAALGYRYPSPSARDELAGALASTPDGDAHRHMRRFLDAVTPLGLGEWEELHTATLDLTSLFVPYVGHLIWGENYRRGAFMADLQAEMEAVGVDRGGELPDHIEPILRYLAVAEQPLPDLLEVLPIAVADMERTLRKAAPDNPYRHVLAATATCAGGRPVTIGGRR